MSGKNNRKVYEDADFDFEDDMSLEEEKEFLKIIVEDIKLTKKEMKELDEGLDFFLKKF